MGRHPHAITEGFGKLSLSKGDYQIAWEAGRTPSSRSLFEDHPKKGQKTVKTTQLLFALTVSLCALSCNENDSKGGDEWGEKCQEAVTITNQQWQEGLDPKLREQILITREDVSPRVLGAWIGQYPGSSIHGSFDFTLEIAELSEAEKQADDAYIVVNLPRGYLDPDSVPTELWEYCWTSCVFTFEIRLNSSQPGISSNGLGGISVFGRELVEEWSAESPTDNGSAVGVPYVSFKVLDSNGEFNPIDGGYKTFDMVFSPEGEIYIRFEHCKETGCVEDEWANAQATRG